MEKESDISEFFDCRHISPNPLARMCKLLQVRPDAELFFTEFAKLYVIRRTFTFRN